MANPTNAFGLKPVRYLNGAPWDGKVRPMLIGTGVGTATFIGDPILLLGAGNSSAIEHIGGSFQVGALSTATIASAGATNKIAGVVVGFMPVTRDSTIYREASTDRIALVACDPFLVYQIRDDASGTIGTALVGANANLTSGSGSTNTGLSGWLLDATTPTNDATFQVTILQAANLLTANDPTTTSAVWEVQINLPQPFPGIVGLA